MQYLALSKDKVPSIRIEFAKSILLIKPFIDYDLDMSLHIMEIMNELKGDKDRDVSDAAENSDYKILHSKKKTKEEEK